MYSLDDTIAAIASAPGGAARGIVRLSGPEVLNCLQPVFQSSDKRELKEPAHPQAFGGLLNLIDIIAPVPCDLYLWPKGRSYTSQKMAEFHTLGSPPLLDALLKSLCTAGARIAEPGEFTLRAFLSGRIDLTQAEAVLGVIDAADPRELHVAVAQLAGGLTGPLHKLRDMLLDFLAHLEAGFDFADEDVPFITSEELQRRLDQALEQVRRLTDQMQSRGSAQTAVRAVLFGQPNTGKSSLFNALTHKEHALVSDLPGTTRDYLVAELDFDGRKCQLIDTAGFHPQLGDCPNFRINENGTVPFTGPEFAEAAGPIKAPDQAAQESAAEQIAQAHIRLLCLDATRPLNAWEQADLDRADASRQIVVWTKLDAARPGFASTLCKFSNRPKVLTSSVTGEGLDHLRVELRQMVHGMEAAKSNIVSSTAVRCRQSLHNADNSLQNARELVETNSGEEFIAAEIRLALDDLGKIVGAVYSDDVLDCIFSSFCVGK